MTDRRCPPLVWQPTCPTATASSGSLGEGGMATVY